MTTYKAFHVTECVDGVVQAIQTLELDDLKNNDTLIRVHYSSLNYKDALSATGNKGVTRQYPHTPGIDAVGVVERSSDESLIGQEVIVTGYDLGMNTYGGYGQYISVPKEWLVPLPKSLTMPESMMYGTAGFTAALSIYKMTKFIKPTDGPILVTGATGGVGSMAIRILNHIGYDVVAVSGKTELYETLRSWGASEIISRQAIMENSHKPLLKGLYAGVIDTVGGDFLSTVMKYVKMNGVVTTCGNVRGQSFTASIFPFILRGIQLQGITSASCDYDTRLAIWKALAQDWKPSNLHEAVTELSLEDLPKAITTMLEGNSKGRKIIKL